MQGKVNRGRHTNHPAGRHSVRTNQCPPPPSPIFYRPDALLPPNQQCQNTEGNYRIRIRENTLEFSSMVLPALSPYQYGNNDVMNLCSLIIIVIIVCYLVQILLAGKAINFLRQVCQDRTLVRSREAIRAAETSQGLLAHTHACLKPILDVTWLHLDLITTKYCCSCILFPTPNIGITY